jgi:hypothetical protein
METRARLVLVAAVLIVTAACGPKADDSVVTITRPAADAPFDRTFTWKPVANATTYHLVVFTPDGARAFEVRDLVTPGVKLSEKVGLAPGRYAVQVTALRDGQTLAESPRAEFEIKN